MSRRTLGIIKVKVRRRRRGKDTPGTKKTLLSLQMDTLCSNHEISEFIARTLRYVLLNDPKDLWVLRIRPSLSVFDPMVCTLQTISLDHFRTFETSDVLSCVWGPKNLSYRLLVDDDPYLRMSDRLRDILLRLRTFYDSTRDEISPVWVNAICINQHDDAERSSQVQQMAKIY